MKKLFSSVMIFMLVASLFGCTNTLKDFNAGNIFYEVTDPEQKDDVVEPEKEEPSPENNEPKLPTEAEMRAFTFNPSNLEPSKHMDAVEDLTIFSIEPTVVNKNALVDIEITYGKEVAARDIGRDYIIEVYIDGLWYDIMNEYKSFVPRDLLETVFFHLEDPILQGNINKQTIPTTTALKYLPVGRYRVLKELSGWKYVEFVVEKPSPENNEQELPTEEEMKNFTFNPSNLEPSKHMDAVEDLTIFSIEPTVVKKDALVDIEIAYGKEGAEGYCGRFYAIEVYIDGIWYDIMNEYKSFVPREYYVALDFPEDPIPMFEINKQTVPMTTAYKYLPVGRYRIVKDMYDWNAVEFIIE